MGNKDKTEKMFVACADVFAELVNVLLYQGEKILKEEEMLPGPTESIYPGQGMELHGQFQDYSMFTVQEGEVHAMYTIENQDSVDWQMALRHAGYDGAAYRRQYKPESTGRKERAKGKQGIYPVISIVLNWSGRRWTAAVGIRELLGYPVPKAAEDYIDKNRIHVFDMLFLEDVVRNRFEGDVRVVLDYLSDRESLTDRRQKLKNPEEVMRMLHALSGDVRYLENIAFMKENGGRNMCELLDEMMNKGIEKGIQQGIQRGEQILVTTCKELGISFEDTAIKLKEKYLLGDVEVQRDMKLYW